MTNETTTGPQPPECYAFVPDGVWDGVADSRADGQAVVVCGSRIESVAPAAELPEDLPRVDLRGTTLLPGFIDAHVHYSSVMGPTFLAAGVTTVRDTGNDLAWILQQRELNEKRSDRGPTIVCCGHLQDGPEKYWPRMGTANADADAVRRSIREHIEAGADAIKLYPGLDVEMTAAGIDETHRLGKPVTAHLGTCGVEDAVSAGLDCIEHLAKCDVAWRAAAPEEDDELIDLLLKHGTAIDPTLVIFDRGARKLDLVFRRDESLRWVHPAHRRYWESGPPQIDDAEAQLERHRTITHLKRFLKRAHERGVIVAIGTDTPFPRLTPGFSLHDEMGLYADAGIAPVDVLRSATSVNARVLAIEARAGRIAPGLDADLVAVRGNPLGDIRAINAVEMVARRGEVLDPEKLHREVEATFDETPDDSITNDLLDRLEMD